MQQSKKCDEILAISRVTHKGMPMVLQPSKLIAQKIRNRLPTGAWPEILQWPDTLMVGTQPTVSRDATNSYHDNGSSHSVGIAMFGSGGCELFINPREAVRLLLAWRNDWFRNYT